MAAPAYTLYYSPGSYYSMKGLLVMYEKNVPFKSSYVNIHAGEATQPWFLKMNPSGKVPVLQHGERFIPESEDIIDYVDKHVDTGPRLVPDVATALGQEVKRFRKLLHDIPIDVMTFGVMCNRHLSVTGLQVPSLVLKFVTQEFIDGKLKKEYRRYEERAKLYPELKEEYNGKMEELESRRSRVMEESNVAAILDDLEDIFDQLEEQLQISNKGKGTEDDVFWLLGNDYTAADMTAGIFMTRLELVGLLSRYISQDKRPLCFQYANRLMQRPAMKKVQAKTKYMLYVYFRTAVKSILPTVCKVGVVVGIAAAAAYAFKKYDLGDQLRNSVIMEWFKQ